MFQNVFKNGHNFQYWNSVFWYNSCSILKTFYGHLVLPTAWGREGGCLQCACQHVQSFISNVSHIQLSPEKALIFWGYVPSRERSNTWNPPKRVPGRINSSSTPLIPKCRFKGEVCRICDRFHGGYTPPKTNMEPNNGGSEDDFPFQTGDFQVPC